MVLKGNEKSNYNSDFPVMSKNTCTSMPKINP